tara:strand:- start:317 stop:574 length:258 start_codon:yes stop_codon:yes gene_type:complete
MPNEKYKRLLNVNAIAYDPVLDFRNRVVEMRRLQTKYNKKRGLELLYETIDAENEVDLIVFGETNGYGEKTNRVLDEKERMANKM